MEKRALRSTMASQEGPRWRRRDRGGEWYPRRDHDGEKAIVMDNGVPGGTMTEKRGPRSTTASQEGPRWRTVSQEGP